MQNHTLFSFAFVTFSHNIISLSAFLLYHYITRLQTEQIISIGLLFVTEFKDMENVCLFDFYSCFSVFYLCVKMIRIAYKMNKEQSIKLILDTIKAAKRKEKITAEVQLHSDQGFQHTSQAYFNLTQSYDIRCQCQNVVILMTTL